MLLKTESVHLMSKFVPNTLHYLIVNVDGVNIPAVQKGPQHWCDHGQASVNVRSHHQDLSIRCPPPFAKLDRLGMILILNLLQSLFTP